MRPRLSTILHATLSVFFATIILLFLPALRSYLSTEGPVDEAREDLGQFLALQRFTYLLERRSIEALDQALIGEDSTEPLEADNEIVRLLVTLRRNADAEEKPEADEMESIEELEDLNRRLRHDTEKILEMSREHDRAAVLDQVRQTFEAQRRDLSPTLDEALLRENNAIGESLDDLLAMSGHFAFVPFLPLGEKIDTLRSTTSAVAAASRFLLRFERLVSEYTVAMPPDIPRSGVDRAAALADQAFIEWRLFIEHHPDASMASLHEVETAYRRFRNIGDRISGWQDPEQRLTAYGEELEPLVDSKLPVLMETSISAAETRLDEILDEIEDQLELAGLVIALITVALATLMLASPWMLSRFIIQPVEELSAAARALGQGDLTQRVHVRGSREILELGQIFNHTAEELGELQEKLKLQERLATIGELAGSIGHELRNPLGTMKSSIFFLRRRRDQSLDAKTEEHLERIDRQIHRADRIITELLDYARNPVTSPRSVDLDEVLDEAVGSVEMPPTVRYERRGGDGAPRVVADPEQVGRILENLVRNAVQAMPEGGELRIGCDARDGEIAVSVADTGIGIPADRMAKIFEPLVTSKARGIGLGLPISLRYAELNRGRIECESEPGRGSLFRLILPAADTGKDHEG